MKWVWGYCVILFIDYYMRLIIFGRGWKNTWIVENGLNGILEITMTVGLFHSGKALTYALKSY